MAIPQYTHWYWLVQRCTCTGSTQSQIPVVFRVAEQRSVVTVRMGGAMERKDVPEATNAPATVTQLVKQPLPIGGPFSSPLIRLLSPAAWIDSASNASTPSTAAAFAAHLSKLGAYAIGEPTGAANVCAVLAVGMLRRCAVTATMHPAAFSIDTVCNACCLCQRQRTRR